MSYRAGGLRLQKIREVLGELQDGVVEHIPGDAVGLREHADKMPAQISGGMKKRAGLARALALDPAIVFFDEPWAGLDPVTSRLGIPASVLPLVVVRPLSGGAALAVAFCFMLGAVGAVVPGMPTTVFLLAGSYCLVRSCPELERRLRTHAWFRRYATYLDADTPVPPQARRAALTASTSKETDE